MGDFFTPIRAVLSTTPARWQALAENLPAGLTGRKPAPGEWSASECLTHLMDTERVFTFRIHCFLAGKDFPDFNPDTEGSKTGERSLKDMAAAFSEMRQESLQLLATLSESDLERSAKHAELGLVTLRQMLSEWAAHDLNHTVQAERALMQPFIAEAGPWQVYFLDHWVGAERK